MFDNSRYISVGIKTNIPAELTVLLFTLIDVLKFETKELDYLQIFEVTVIPEDDMYKCIIIHSQEQPEYKREHEFYIKEKPELSEFKIYVIDEHTEGWDGYTTMILAEEY